MYGVLAAAQERIPLRSGELIDGQPRQGKGRAHRCKWTTSGVDPQIPTLHRGGPAFSSSQPRAGQVQAAVQVAVQCRVRCSKMEEIERVQVPSVSVRDGSVSLLVVTGYWRRWCSRCEYSLKSKACVLCLSWLRAVLAATLANSRRALDTLRLILEWTRLGSRHQIQNVFFFFFFWLRCHRCLPICLPSGYLCDGKVHIVLTSDPSAESQQQQTDRLSRESEAGRHL